MAILDRNFNLSQRMVQELGRTIICGEFSDDSLPTEAELCEKFGVSRSAVREAVKMLSAKGLISSKPRQGIRIQPEDQWNIFDPDLLRWTLESRPTLKVLKEFLQVRIAIEPEAASLAARYADDKKIDAIEQALEQMLLDQGGIPLQSLVRYMRVPIENPDQKSPACRHQIRGRYIPAVR